MVQLLWRFVSLIFCVNDMTAAQKVQLTPLPMGHVTHVAINLSTLLRHYIP